MPHVSGNITAFCSDFNLDKSQFSSKFTVRSAHRLVNFVYHCSSITYFTHVPLALSGGSHICCSVCGALSPGTSSSRSSGCGFHEGVGLVFFALQQAFHCTQNSSTLESGRLGQLLPTQTHSPRGKCRWKQTEQLPLNSWVLNQLTHEVNTAATYGLRKPIFWKIPRIHFREFGSTFMLLKMIKEGNVDDTNQLYLTLHEVNSLYLENCKMGLKARKFYRIKI